MLGVGKSYCPAPPTSNGDNVMDTKKKFNITLEETVRRRIQVEAKNEEQARFAVQDGEGHYLELPKTVKYDIQQVFEVEEAS